MNFESISFELFLNLFSTIQIDSPTHIQYVLLCVLFYIDIDFRRNIRVHGCWTASMFGERWCRKLFVQQKKTF